MQIKLKRLSIRNFKGVTDFECLLNHTTNIYGDNATGKTTVFDAFLWLFFGKNSDGDSKFQIKRLDKDGNFIKDLEAEVEAILLVDHREIAVKKVLRQKWVKRRGEMEANYNGDENIYFWNDVPLKESEFNAKIKEIIDESIFRLISNPYYFNSLKWQERRNILIDIAGNISNEEILDSIITVTNKGQFLGLINALDQKKTVDEYKREIAAKKKKIKDEAESIPSRIDEVRRGMPADRDYTLLRAELEKRNQELNQVEAELNDEVAKLKAEGDRRAKAMKHYNELLQEKQQRSFDLQTKLRNIEFEVKHEANRSGSEAVAEKNATNRNLADKVSERDRYKKAIDTLEKELAGIEASLQNLRQDYIKTDEEQLSIDPHSFNCPTCHQPLPETAAASRKETLTANFNKSKTERLEKISMDAARIKEQGKTTRERIVYYNRLVSELSSEITLLTSQLERLEKALSEQRSAEDVKDYMLAGNTEYQQLVRQLDENEARVIPEPEFSPLKENEELISKRRSIQQDIKVLQLDLSQEDAMNRSIDRIKELEHQESTLARELAGLEGTEYAILQFTKAKVDAIERRINDRFQFVRFKMFEKQVNGGETETCETLVNSNGSFVPFSDANNAAKINAGLDIINTLTQHYKVSAPVFIDNRESVTRLINSDSQIVNLFVSEPDKKLRVA